MSYYIGFRFGWVRLGRHLIGWHDARLYHHGRASRQFGAWKVWMQ